MEYEMEELLPLVARLADKYTGRESTSVSYEKAEQLMGAILYCIHETQTASEHTAAVAAKLSAEEAYVTGRQCVMEKVKAALALYNEIAREFRYYENRCLYDTFIKGFPEFFRRYDVLFDPQNTVLTLDYPVLKDLSAYSGIDKIYEYLLCISEEQHFLARYPESYVSELLRGYTAGYQDMIENIQEIVLMMEERNGSQTIIDEREGKFYEF